VFGKKLIIELIELIEIIELTLIELTESDKGVKWQLPVQSKTYGSYKYISNYKMR